MSMRPILGRIRHIEIALMGEGFGGVNVTNPRSDPSHGNPSR